MPPPKKKHDAYLLSHNLSDIGEVYSLQGRSHEALTCLSRALAMQKQNKDQRGTAETAILLGNLFLREKNYVSAKKNFDSARTIAVNMGSKDVQKNAWKGLSSVYSSINNYPAALDAYYHYAGLKDTLYSEESSRQIAEMQTRYNTEKKEKENVLLQKENVVKNLQITKEKNQKYILVASFAFLVIVSAIYYNQYRLKQKNEILKERELRAYAVFQAQENEKEKLSKDLHDGVGALLSLIKLNISSIAPDEASEKILARTKNLASDAMKEVRGIAHDLMPGVLAKAGLQPALVEMAESVSAPGNIDVQLSCNLPERLPPVIEGHIFRIIQEATNNILKHANASTEVINISASRDHIEILIADNGAGFDKAILSRITGNGLNNMYSRVNALKGEINIVTEKGNGTKINISLPVKTNSYA